MRVALSSFLLILIRSINISGRNCLELNKKILLVIKGINIKLVHLFELLNLFKSDSAILYLSGLQIKIFGTLYLKIKK